MRHAVLILLSTMSLAWAGESVTVFAAASMTNAVSELAKAYEARTGVRIITSFAASSTLAKQIENGAPADVFMSADLKWMDHLEERSLIDPSTRRNVLGNSLVIVAPLGRSFICTVDKDFPAEAAFTGRMAMGDPSNVPLGIYAKEAFTRVGWWSWLERRIAPTADARAALRLVESAEVDCGVVYASDAALSAKVQVITTVPAELHMPVRYPFACTANAGAAARACLAHLSGSDAKPVYERYGFTVLP
jgi:molybdate transport system substrate-binding protein